jgi:hypothetical protein
VPDAVVEMQVEIKEGEGNPPNLTVYGFIKKPRAVRDDA